MNEHRKWLLVFRDRPSITLSVGLQSNGRWSAWSPDVQQVVDPKDGLFETAELAVANAVTEIALVTGSLVHQTISPAESEQQARAGVSLEELQQGLPWGAHGYSEEFDADKSQARDAKHATFHVMKAVGKLATAIEDYDHTGAVDRKAAMTAIADVLWCLLRTANSIPGKPIDAAGALLARFAEKFPEQYAGANKALP